MNLKQPQTSNLKPQTNSQLQTPNPKQPKTTNQKPQTYPQTPNPKLQTTSNLKPQTSNELPTPNPPSSLPLSPTMSETPKKKKIFDFSLLGRVFQFVKPYRSFFYISIVLAIVMAVFAPVRPYLIQLTVDKATGKTMPIPHWLELVLFKTDLSDAAKFIIAVSIFQVIFLFIETGVRFFFTFLTAWMGQSVVRDM